MSRPWYDPQPGELWFLGKATRSKHRHVFIILDLERNRPVERDWVTIRFMCSCYNSDSRYEHIPTDYLNDDELFA